jgi:uncharacterized protein involved in type VI secretion and phage assembly
MTTTAPRSRSTDRRWYGVAEALVEEVEGDPAKECRVKLTFPWFDGGRTVSDWCRVARPYAGGGYGIVFGPEKHDEVLVAFVHGDMRYPIVLAGLHNGVDKPPTERTADKDQKLLRTRHGHQVLLDDSPGAEAVRVTTSHGHAIDLDDTPGAERVQVTSEKGHTVHLDDVGGKVVVETSTGVSVTLEDSNTVTVKGATVKVEAQKIDLGSPVGEKLILGQRFMVLFNAHMHTLGPIPTTPPVTPMTNVMFSSVVEVSPR